VFVYACNACVTPIGLVKPPKEMSDVDYVAGTAGQEVRIRTGPGEGAGPDAPVARPPAGGRGAGGGGRAAGAGRGAAPAGGGGLTVQGLPLMKPPYSTISAINLDKGDIVWQVPHGETPDAIRNHTALKGLQIPRTGQSGYNIGTLVTRSLVIAGDGQITTTASGVRGAMLRAYDKATGKEVGAIQMPAPQSGSPMTYMVNGKQYVVVAVSGGPYSGEYIAYSLSSEE
jgi:quinoprotein glucose dehydrogenase